MSYEVKWEDRGVVRRFHGRVVPVESSEFIQQIVGDPRYDQLRYWIADYRGAEFTEFSDEDLTYISAMHVGAFAINPHVLIVAIAADPQAVAVLERYRRLNISGYDLKICASEPEARAWIAARLESPLP